MKMLKLIVPMLMLASVSGLSAANHVFSFEDKEEAFAKAKKRGKQIAFVFT